MNRILCPRCGKRVKYPDEYAGRDVKCPKCEHRITLPTLSTASTPEDSSTSQSSDSILRRLAHWLSRISNPISKDVGHQNTMTDEVSDKAADSEHRQDSGETQYLSLETDISVIGDKEHGMILTRAAHARHLDVAILIIRNTDKGEQILAGGQFSYFEGKPFPWIPGAEYTIAVLSLDRAASILESHQRGLATFSADIVDAAKSVMRMSDVEVIFNMRWYYREYGLAPQGPLKADELNKRIQRKQISRNAEVSVNKHQWYSLSELLQNSQSVTRKVFDCWYYSTDKHDIHGPVSTQQLRELFQCDKLHKDSTFVSIDGESWYPANVAIR